ncbi:LysR family transcriptional regulator [Aureimonas sp. AU4]|uniref:LysR family transcriptional regulator n=1 Tax=Aureimonas sp. AU4 TaxID=1638163 RepID=UPI0007811DC1|nr:LysR family transcriptional regulator [Aureimonas sp. AU4]
MPGELADLDIFVAVARAKGFREAARLRGSSASALSEAVRRLESSLGVRLLHRTTRSVAPTEAGARLLAQLEPALREVGAALDGVHALRDRPAGTLRLNVPVVAARIVLPRIVAPFLQRYPEIRLEITAEDTFVDLPAAGCDAGIRYGERLDGDMIAVPIGPRQQRTATGAAPGYLARCGTPRHPRDLLDHACLTGRFRSGVLAPWEFTKDGETIAIEPRGPLVVSTGTAMDLAIASAVAGLGVVHLFEAWLEPLFDRGELVPILEDWWDEFPGPFLYYPGRRLVPAPLRAFLDFVRETSDRT